MLVFILIVNQQSLILITSTAQTLAPYCVQMSLTVSSFAVYTFKLFFPLLAYPSMNSYLLRSSDMLPYLCFMNYGSINAHFCYFKSFNTPV